MTTQPSGQAATSFAATGHQPGERTILVMDDHLVFAEALAAVFGDLPGLQALAVTTHDQARQVLAGQPVDVLLLSFDMTSADGLDVARNALAQRPGLYMVAVTASLDVHRLVAAVRAGVRGWVAKDEPVEQLVAVVRGVLRGETWIPPQLLTGVLEQLMAAQDAAADDDQLLASLTKREREVLDCLVRGMKPDEIAGLLCLSRNTLRTHIRNILRKLKVHSVLAAVALMRRVS